MGIMPAVIDWWNVPGFRYLMCQFNDDLGSPGGNGVTRREEALKKLLDLNGKKQWSGLLDDLKFYPEVSQAKNAGTAAVANLDPHAKHAHDEVYGHFQNDWNNQVNAWFPNVPWPDVLEALGRGFLAAIHVAKKGRPKWDPLPITVMWVCSDPVSTSPDFFVDHIVTDFEVVVVVSTPIPEIYNPPLSNNTDTAIEELEDQQDDVFDFQGKAVKAVLEARIARFKDAAGIFALKGCPIEHAIIQLEELLPLVPTSLEEAEALDEKLAETGEKRVRLAVEMVLHTGRSAGSAY